MVSDESPSGLDNIAENSIPYTPGTKNTDNVEKICRYIREMKNYSADDISRFISFNPDLVSKHLFPIEERCHYCENDLLLPVLISSKVTIITLSGIHKGFSSYSKQCPTCELQYRYQESNLGIHNFNDVFFLAFDLCLFSRYHVQQNNSIISC